MKNNLNKNKFSTLKKLLNNGNNNQIIAFLNDIKNYDNINKTNYLIKSYYYIIDLYFKKNNIIFFKLLKHDPIIIEKLYDYLSHNLLYYGTSHIINMFFNNLYKIYDKCDVTYNFSIKIIEKSESLSPKNYVIDDILNICLEKFKETDLLKFIKLCFDHENSSRIHDLIIVSLCYVPFSFLNIKRKTLIKLDELLSNLILNIKNMNKLSEPLSQLLNGLNETNLNYKKIYLLNKSVKSFIDVVIDNQKNHIKDIFLLFDDIIPLKYLIYKMKQRKDVDIDFYIKEYLIYHPEIDNIKAFI